MRHWRGKDFDFDLGSKPEKFKSTEARQKAKYSYKKDVPTLRCQIKAPHFLIFRFFPNPPRPY